MNLYETYYDGYAHRVSQRTIIILREIMCILMKLYEIEAALLHNKNVFEMMKVYKITNSMQYFRNLGYC